MGLFSEWRERREIERKTRAVNLQRQHVLLDLFQQEAKMMETISSSYRGITSRSIFGGENTGSDWETDYERQLTGFAALESRIKSARVLVRSNPFARSAITNMIHYVIGEDGLQFHLNDPSKKSAADKVSEGWHRWSLQNNFLEAQAEILRRVMRDGAVYVRWFDNATFRFVEPIDIEPPSNATSESARDWGIEVDENDALTRKTYYVKVSDTDVEAVPAEQIDYLNWKDADSNVLRPSPIFYDFIEFLEGAAGIIRNMRSLIRVQSAIAIIREHPEGLSGSAIAAWATARADTTITDSDTENSVRQEKWRPGTVMDVKNGAKVHFPAAQMATDKMVAGLQAELRAVAAALGLPEFIFTADAASSNYASLMAAEGPAVKTFEAFQGWIGRFLLKMHQRVMLAGATKGIAYTTPDGKQEQIKFPSKVLKMSVSVQGPSVKSRDQFSEARTNAIYAGLGVLSPQQVAGSLGLDYNEMQRQIDEHNSNWGERSWPPMKGNDTDQKTGSEKRDAGGAEGGETDDQ